jgi:endonuclease YncB( thermonuclease family)
VTSVYDGDTVHIKADGTGETITVRLEGINAPELGEAFGPEARNAARVMLFDKRVQLKGTDVDVYHRLVARITVAGTDSSLELVKAGLACHFKRYSSEAALAAAEIDARAHNRGFWARGVRQPACATNALRASRPSPSAVTGPLHGNRVSRVYHAPWCKNYNCKNCTVIFQSEPEAKAAGFRLAGDCLMR